MPRFSWLALITKGISKSDANHEKLFGEYVFHRPLYQFVHEMPFRSCERISQDFLQVFRPDVFSNPMRCLLLRILVGLTRGSIVGLARRRSTMLSVLCFLVLPSGRMSVGIAYAATSPCRGACARTGEVLARSCCACSRRIALKLQLCPAHDEASSISISMRYPSCTSLVELPRGASALFPNTFLVELPHRSSVEDDVRNWALTYVSTRLARSRPGKVLARDSCACSRRVALHFSLAALTTWKYIARLGLAHRLV